MYIFEKVVVVNEKMFQCAYKARIISPKKKNYVTSFKGQKKNRVSLKTLVTMHSRMIEKVMEMKRKKSVLFILCPYIDR